MRFVQKGRAATLELYLPRRPSAAGTYTVYTATGAELQASGAASLDSVSTTLSPAADSGAGAITLTSATSVTAGRRYLLDGTEDTGGEMVTVRSISGTTVTLAARLLRAHASAGRPAEGRHTSTRCRLGVSPAGSKPEASTSQGTLVHSVKRTASSRGDSSDCSSAMSMIWLWTSALMRFHTRFGREGRSSNASGPPST